MRKIKGLLIGYDKDTGRSIMPKLVDVTFEDEEFSPMLDSVRKLIGCQWVDIMRPCGAVDIWIDDEGRLTDQRVNVFVRNDRDEVFDVCGAVLMTPSEKIYDSIKDDEHLDILLESALKLEVLAHVRPAPPNTEAEEPRIEVTTFDIEDLSKRVN